MGRVHLLYTFTQASLGMPLYLYLTSLFNISSSNTVLFGESLFMDLKKYFSCKRRIVNYISLVLHLISNSPLFPMMVLSSELFSPLLISIFKLLLHSFLCQLLRHTEQIQRSFLVSRSTF